MYPNLENDKINDIKHRKKFEEINNNISKFKLFLDFTSKRCEKVLKLVKKVLRKLTPNYNLHVIWKTINLSKYVNHRLMLDASVFFRTLGIYLFKYECKMNTYR